MIHKNTNITHWLPANNRPEENGEYLVNILGLGLGRAKFNTADRMGSGWSMVSPFVIQNGISCAIVTHWTFDVVKPVMDGPLKTFEEYWKEHRDNKGHSDIDAVFAIWNAGKNNLK